MRPMDDAPAVNPWQAKAEQLAEKLRRTMEDQGAFPAGQYGSTVPSREYVWQRTAIDRPAPPTLPGIAIDAGYQLERLESLRGFGAQFARPDAPDGVHRYHCNNEWFGTPDAVGLYCMMRHARPKRIIEVGCGYSSALMIDVNEAFFDRSIEFTFVEPDPERLLKLLRPGDKLKANIVALPVEVTSPELYEPLREGDILFIDSSHVIKFGNDLAQVLFSILPVIAPGVFVHFHDIFYPFEYPRDWLRMGRFWNECYVLRALLTDNPTFRIELFNDYLEQFHPDALRAVSPRWTGGGSLWLRKLPAPEYGLPER